MKKQLQGEEVDSTSICVSSFKVGGGGGGGGGGTLFIT